MLRQFAFSVRSLNQVKVMPLASQRTTESRTSSTSRGEADREVQTKWWDHHPMVHCDRFLFPGSER